MAFNPYQLDEDGAVPASVLADILVTASTVQGEVAGLVADALCDPPDVDCVAAVRRAGESLLRIVEDIDGLLAAHAERWRMDRMRNPDPPPVVRPVGAREARGYAIESQRQGEFGVLPPAGIPECWRTVKTFTGKTALDRATELRDLLTDAFRLGLETGRKEARPLLHARAALEPAK